MVYWNDKDRGIRLAADNGVKGLHLYCTACRHHASLLWPEVLKRWRVGTYARDMAASLKCSQCGERKGCIMVRAWGPGEP